MNLEPNNKSLSFAEFLDAATREKSELFAVNKDVLVEQMNLFIVKFNDLKTMLERDDIDGMRAMMRHSTERRALFDKK